MKSFSLLPPATAVALLGETPRQGSSVGGFPDIKKLPPHCLLCLLPPVTAIALTLSSVPLVAASDRQETITQVSFKPPADDKQPERTEGAGSRQDWQCPQDAAIASSSAPSATPPVLMALVPRTNYGLTIAARPTFFIYLPRTSAKQVVLSIREEGIRHHSQQFFPITGEPGIIRLTPASDSPPLEVGKTYQWAVVLVCGERPSPNDPAIASWVERIAPPTSVPAQRDRQTPLAQAAWYGNQGIWYDALTALSQARHTQVGSPALSGIWANFLSSVGLDRIATQPLQF